MRLFLIKLQFFLSFNLSLQFLMLLQISILSTILKLPNHTDQHLLNLQLICYFHFVLMQLQHCYYVLNFIITNLNHQFILLYNNIITIITCYLQINKFFWVIMDYLSFILITMGIIIKVILHIMHHIFKSLHIQLSLL